MPSMNNGTATAIHVLVAACDTHSSAHSNSSGSPPLTPRDSVDALRDSITCVTTKQRGVNASRDRMKQEMQQLRDSVEELQRQLDELKRDHNTRRVPDQKEESNGDVEDPSTKQLAVAWETMARGQCEQRYRAEVENVKLRKMLDEQVKVAHTLERILSKRRGTEGLLDMKPRTKRPRTVMCPIDRPNLYSDLELGLPSLYSQVDAVLRKENFLRRHDEPFRDIDVRHSDEIGSYVEATERRLIPFSHVDVSQSAWEYLVDYPEATHLHGPCQRQDITRNTTRGDIDVAMQLARFTGHVHAKYVARRFVERERVVIVWVAIVDPSEMAEAAVDGVVLRHTGWICARPAPLSTPDSTAVMTEYLTALLSVPEVYDELNDRKRRLATLTNFLVSSVTYQLEGNNKNLDNLLLERALSRTKMSLT